MKQVNVKFDFSINCPYNLDGTCTNDSAPVRGVLQWSCGIGKSTPPAWCPLPEVKEEEKTILNLLPKVEEYSSYINAKRDYQDSDFHIRHCPIIEEEFGFKRRCDLIHKIGRNASITDIDFEDLEQ